MKEYVQLIENNLGLAYYVANKWNTRTTIKYDDILSDCFIGLLNASKAFDNTRNIQFCTFAIRCMENEILMSMRKEKKYQKEVYFSSLVITKSDGEEYDLLDVLLSHENNDNIDAWIQDEDIKNFIKDAFKKLNRTEKIIIYEYLKGMKQREIADKYGYSQSYISRVLKVSKEKIAKIESKKL